MEILRLSLYWSLMCLIIIPLFNWISGKRLTDGVLFVFLNGTVLMVASVLIFVLTDLILIIFR